MGHDDSHSAKHTNGTDDIQNATAAQKGLATAAQITALESAIGVQHTQNTDTGTNATNFSINGSNAIKEGDARLSDARTPTAHTHGATDINSGTLDGDRLPALSATKKGGVPATGTPIGLYLKDDGTWAAPSAGSQKSQGFGGSEQQTSSSTFIKFLSISFLGTTKMSAPTKIHVNAYMAGGTSYGIQIIDKTNGDAVICSQTGLTNTTETMIDMGTLTNLPAAKALWHVELKKTGGGNARASGGVVEW